MKSTKLNEEILDELAVLFKVFGDSTRLTILSELMDNEMCVGDLAEKIDMNQSAVSHQLATLKQARLVKVRREGKSIFYSIADDHVYTIIRMGVDHIIE